MGKSETNLIVCLKDVSSKCRKYGHTVDVMWNFNSTVGEGWACSGITKTCYVSEMSSKNGTNHYEYSHKMVNHSKTLRAAGTRPV